MNNKITLKYGSTKYKGFFFLDGQFDYKTNLNVDNNQNIQVIKCCKPFENFLSKENKEKRNDIKSAIKSNKTRSYIVEIWEPLNKAITKVDQIPNVEYYYSKAKKYLK